MIATSMFLTAKTIVDLNAQKPRVATATEREPVVVILDKAKLYELVNTERVNAGLPPLVVNPLLEQSACLKAQDMVERDYWSHDSPEGEEPWRFFVQVGYAYSHVGENQAYGYNSETETVHNWMSSISHKENILSSYADTGICVLNNISYQSDDVTNLVVQHFGTQ